MRRTLLAAAAVGGLTVLGATGATAAPIAGRASHYAVPQQHIVQADWWWRHHHWHHRHWWHGDWHYWD